MNRKKQQFVKTVWEYYSTYGRHNLPWRKTRNPYRILVSEVMLQQTQVERVIPKYREFLKLFPTVQRLAAAPLSDVLRVWQGLGYNRRAKFLWQAGQEIVSLYHGTFPREALNLRTLPGVGTYTAGAIMAFAYNQSVLLIETNIRQVFIHHFFSKNETVSDDAILQLIEKTLPESDWREWYYALMDYGSFLKQRYGNMNRKSTHYRKQTTFAGSDRQLRGAIIKLLSEKNVITTAELQSLLPNFATERIVTQLFCLQVEGLLCKNNERYQLP